MRVFLLESSELGILKTYLPAHESRNQAGTLRDYSDEEESHYSSKGTPDIQKNDVSIHLLGLLPYKDNSSIRTKFQDLVSTFNFICLLNCETRGANCLDNILVNCDQNIQTNAFDPSLSDHSAVTASIILNEHGVVSLYRPMPEAVFSPRSKSITVELYR